MMRRVARTAGQTVGREHAHEADPVDLSRLLRAYREGPFRLSRVEEVKRRKDRVRRMICNPAVKSTRFPQTLACRQRPRKNPKSLANTFGRFEFDVSSVSNTTASLPDPFARCSRQAIASSRTFLISRS